MKRKLEQALQIAREVVPSQNVTNSCMIVGAALAGLTGLSMKHIRIGALFYPTKFVDDPYLSMRGGWGCEGFSSQTLYLADPTVDLDGGFSGHTWIEENPYWVTDLMYDVIDSPREIYDPNCNLIGRYIHRPALEVAVKRFWNKEMKAALRAAKKSLDF